MSRRTYAPPPTLRPLYEFAQAHPSPHVTMDAPSGLDRPEGGELVVRWRGARIHIRLDPTGYSWEIPRRTVARYHSRELGMLRGWAHVRRARVRNVGGDGRARVRDACARRRACAAALCVCHHLRGGDNGQWAVVVAYGPRSRPTVNESPPRAQTILCPVAAASACHVHLKPAQGRPQTLPWQNATHNGSLPAQCAAFETH